MSDEFKVYIKFPNIFFNSLKNVFRKLKKINRKYVALMLYLYFECTPALYNALVFT